MESLIPSALDDAMASARISPLNLALQIAVFAVFGFEPTCTTAFCGTEANDALKGDIFVTLDFVFNGYI